MCRCSPYNWGRYASHPWGHRSGRESSSSRGHTWEGQCRHREVDVFVNVWFWFYSGPHSPHKKAEEAEQCVHQPHIVGDAGNNGLLTVRTHGVHRRRLEHLPLQHRHRSSGPMTSHLDKLAGPGPHLSCHRMRKVTRWRGVHPTWIRDFTSRIWDPPAGLNICFLHKLSTLPGGGMGMGIGMGMGMGASPGTCGGIKPGCWASYGGGP